MSKQKLVVVGAVLVAVVALAGCANLKTPAQEALGAVESAFAAVRDEASRYAPDQMATISQAIDGLRNAFTKGEFQKVIDDAKGVTSQIDGLKGVIESNKAMLQGQWNDMVAGLPGVVEAIQGRMDILSQAKKLPDGMTKDDLAAAVTSLDGLKQAWTRATQSFDGGDLMGAVTSGGEVKKAAAELMTKLGMEVPAALAN